MREGVSLTHLVDDDEGQLLECRRHLKRRGWYEPCGWSKRVTQANRSALLPWRLVDSAEGDLKRTREWTNDVNMSAARIREQDAAREEECERDAKRARIASSAPVVHVPVLSGPMDSSAPVVVVSEQMMQ